MKPTPGDFWYLGKLPPLGTANSFPLLWSPFQKRKEGFPQRVKSRGEGGARKGQKGAAEGRAEDQDQIHSSALPRYTHTSSYTHVQALFFSKLLLLRVNEVTIEVTMVATGL